ncbi:MAG: GTPase Era [Candidatus Marinimicrobia bacterium]|nr:GTPase Era [Candidatus Neomarinimicrobiota bacterium]
MNENVPDARTRCGFVAVLGGPNAGKSTLVNALVGSKVSIVTPRAQTTRSIVRGIAMSEQTQIIFLDTPGIFDAKKRFERAIVSAAWSGANDADVVLLVIDAAKESSRQGFSSANKKIFAQLSKLGSKALLVLNKIDICEKVDLLNLTAMVNDLNIFSEIFMVSALTGDGLEKIRLHLTGTLSQGPWMFPEDDISDMPLRLLSAEITREKLFFRLRQELPYSCAVEVERWEEKNDGSVWIEQTIYVSRESHRPIVLGQGGKNIKAIGASARIEFEKYVNRRVHLFLHVKVNERWLDERRFYSSWGLDFNA